MIRRSSLFLIALSILTLSSAQLAQADVPFLRWERGMVQQVVLGGEASKGVSKIELVGTGTAPLVFQQSDQTSDNFYVYTVMIPSDAPLGQYQVIATKSGLPSLIAGIELSGTTSYKVVRVPRDLLAIVGIFVFITAFASTLRSRKYSELSFDSTQRIPQEYSFQKSEKIPLFTRIKNLPYETRVKAISGFGNSLLKFLLIREGELIHRLSKNAYSYMPIVGFFAGAMAANETDRAGGVGKVGITIFLTIGLIAIIDSYTGILALFGFWFTSLIFGSVGSLGDVLLMFAVGLGWLGPIFTLSIFRNTVAIDFGRDDAGGAKPLGKGISLLTGSLFGAAVFFMSQKLVNSILVTVDEARSVSFQALAVVTSALIVRGLADAKVVSRPINTERAIVNPVVSIKILRVNSFQTALSISIVTYLFALAWIENSQSALIVMALFSAPYYLLLIRFNRFVFAPFGKIPRNIMLESVLVASISIFIYREISSLPLLIDARAQKFLIYAGIPGIIHALYSIICDSSQRDEKVEA
jgi:hypothetical protein